VSLPRREKQNTIALDTLPYGFDLNSILKSYSQASGATVVYSILAHRARHIFTTIFTEASAAETGASDALCARVRARGIAADPKQY